MEKTQFIIDVSGEPRKILVYVNKEGNLVLEGIGSIHYEMIEEELFFAKGND